MARTKMSTGSGNTREKILYMKTVKPNNFCIKILHSFKSYAKPL
jgi:hypothetical protein